MFPLYHALGKQDSSRLIYLGYDGTDDKMWICAGVSNQVLTTLTLTGVAASSNTLRGITYANGDIVLSEGGYSTTNHIIQMTGISTTVQNTYNLPQRGGGGLTFDGTDLWWAVEWSATYGSEKIRHLDGVSGTSIGSFTPPKTNPSGISNDGTNLLTSDRTSGSGDFYRHSGYTATTTVSFAAGSSGGAQLGITSDGTNLITYIRNTVRVHDGFTSTVDTTFSPPSGATRIYDMEYIPSL